MNELIEEWRDIKSYEGLYQVSNLGRIKSLNYRRSGKEGILRSSINSKGYLTVSLGNKTFSVHQLVAESFLNHTIDKYTMVVNHIDGNKLNNNINNLESVSHRSNCSSEKCFRKNSKNYTSEFDGVSLNKTIKKYVVYIQFENKNYNIGNFLNELEASSEYKIALTNIENNTFKEYINKKKENRLIKVSQYSMDYKFIKEWNSATEAAKELGIANQSISSCCLGKRKSAGGFKWKYSIIIENQLIIDKNS